MMKKKALQTFAMKYVGPYRIYPQTAAWVEFFTGLAGA